MAFRKSWLTVPGWRDWTRGAVACLALPIVCLAEDKDKVRPEYPNVEIQVTFLKGTDLKSCSTDGLTLSGTQASFRYGRVGSSSQITWSFVERSEFGDIYKFSRISPGEGKERQTSQREVIYPGREVPIWQDEEQRITIKPRPPREP